MAVFICYSHADKVFVDSLARTLVKNKTRVWLDRWELKVGDSLVQKIQDAITEADALLVVLSNASVESEWVKRELSAATIRELEEKRVLILPVVIDDCQVPLLLRDKVYVDFRSDFGEGIQQILETVARITSDSLGRITDKEYYTDLSFYPGFTGENYFIDIFLVSLPNDSYPISIMTNARIIANEIASKRLLKIVEDGLEDVAKHFVLGTFLYSGVLDKQELTVLLKESQPVERRVGVKDNKGRGYEYFLRFEVRRLGEDTGKDIVFHTGSVISQAIQFSMNRGKRLSREEMEKLAKIAG